jgi:sugar phosphate isomerase/epimerase
VPSDDETFARVNAAVQVGGGVLLATGKLPRVASAVLACTVIPGSLGAHMFWSEPDPQRKAEKRRDFLTDLSLLGGLMIASADTAGKPSLGWRGRQAAGRISEAVSGALPIAASNGPLLDTEVLGEKIGHGLQVSAERGRELASTAAEKSAPLLEAARKRGEELAESERLRELAETARQRGSRLTKTARHRGSEFAEVARERGSELAETARERGAELAETVRQRGPELAETARERGSELAETARERGEELATTARKRAKARRKR